MGEPDYSPFPSLGEDEFEAIFQLIPCSDGGAQWTKEEIYDSGIPDTRVWTIVESDDNNALWCLAGWHGVNAFGYAVSTVSWEDPRTEGLYMAPTDEGDEICDTCWVSLEYKACSQCWHRCTNCCTDDEHICGVDFMAGAICTQHEGHDGAHHA